MDASFVPPLSFGAGVLKAIRPITSLPLDVHVMAVHPDKLIEDLMDAGADGITYHVETVEDGPALIPANSGQRPPGGRYPEPCHASGAAASGPGYGGYGAGNDRKSRVWGTEADP